MGCGKSKHDVVTGNTTTIKKPLESESVIKRQESCRCRKSNNVSAVETAAVNNNDKKLEEKVGVGGDCGDKAAEETVEDKKPEEKDTAASPEEVIAAAIVPENIVTMENVNDVNESGLAVEEQKDDTEIISPEVKVEELKSDVQTLVKIESEVEENSATKNDEIQETMTTTNDEILATYESRVNTESEVQENSAMETETQENQAINETPVNTESEVQETSAMETETQAINKTSVNTESEVQETSATENDETQETFTIKNDNVLLTGETQETLTTRNDDVLVTNETPASNEIPVAQEEEKVDNVEEKASDVTKEVESA